MDDKDLEFHYVISYRECYGWSIAADVEDAVMSDGSIYEWYPEGGGGWLAAFEDSDNEKIASIAALDTKHYRVLQSALRQMNGEPNA